MNKEYAIKLLIFDFDGTLADTGTVIRQTIWQTLTQLDQQTPAYAELTPYIGLPLASIFEKACPACDEQLIDEAVRIYRDRFPENCKTGICLYPGVKETLANLRKAGLLMAIASSREKNSLLTLTRELGIQSDFFMIAGEQDVARHKPEPDVAILVLEKANIPAKNAMFIGDTIFDIATGQAAGMLTCGVCYGTHPKERLIQAGADYVIDRFSELEKIVTNVL